MYIADIVLTIIEQVFDFPLILSHKLVEEIDVLESAVDFNLNR